MNTILAANDISGAQEEAPTSFVSRFLRATGLYALAMFGAMFFAFLWMAKDVMFAPISSRWIEPVADALVAWFVLRHISGAIREEENRSLIAPILQSLGFEGAAEWVRKHQGQAGEQARKRRTY